MTLDEYKKIAGTLTADNATAVFTDMLKGIEKDLAELEGAKSTIAEQNTKIKDLQDTNMKLFLSVTGKAETHEEEEEKTPDDFRNDLINLIKED